MTSTARSLADFGLIGRPEDPDLKGIARLAAHICGVPTATVNLLDGVHQYNVATEGFERTVVPVEESFCATTVKLDAPVYVRDARRDERFANHPHVTGELGNIRFYAGSQLRTADGTTVGTLCVFDDVVRELDLGQAQALDDLAAQAVQVLELRAQAERLAASNSELSRSNADLASFAGSLAHDLRNPLTAIAGFLYIAQSRFGDELTGRARDCVVHAVDATTRMTELVNDLLAYATVGAKVRSEPVDVSAVVEGVRRDVGTLTTSSGGSVEVGPLPTISSDRTLLRQLLQNFITNGLKYARPGIAPVVVVRGHSDGDGWELSVTDNGRGIPAAERDGIFDPFVRLPGGMDVHGTGIGLATCARIADVLGAQITVSDAEGGGTVFTVRAHGR